MSDEGYLGLVSRIPGGGQRIMIRDENKPVLHLDCFVELSEERQVELQVLLLRFIAQQ
jgi:hypothetical protein